MIGIYKLKNKKNGKLYIGQSIHCGKRFDEHCGGNQLIDEIIQLEGIENFSFEILKEVEKEELNYWEDYYIMKFGTIFPKGYNKRWNSSWKEREKIEKRIREEKEEEEREKESRREVGIPSYNRSENFRIEGGVRTPSNNRNENLETEEKRKMGVRTLSNNKSGSLETFWESEGGVRTESPDDWGDLKLGMGVVYFPILTNEEI